MRKAMLSVALAVAMCVGPASASGPYLYDTPFVHDYSFESVLTIGVIPHYLDPDELETLVVFLRLAGRFREEHVELFRSVAKKPEDRGAASREFERLRREVRLLLVQESDKNPASLRRHQGRGLRRFMAGSGRDRPYVHKPPAYPQLPSRRIPEGPRDVPRSQVAIRPGIGRTIPLG